MSRPGGTAVYGNTALAAMIQVAAIFYFPLQFCYLAEPAHDDDMDTRLPENHLIRRLLNILVKLMTLAKSLCKQKKSKGGCANTRSASGVVVSNLKV